MKYEIKNRFTGEVQYLANIECDESCTNSVRAGLAVIDAILHGVNLRGADLSGADLRGQDLRGADVSVDDLVYAYLNGADLRGAALDDMEDSS